MYFQKKKIDPKGLIDIACAWLDSHQSNYIQIGSSRNYVAGCCQTDLRAFLNKCLDEKMDLYDAIGLARDDEYKIVWK